MRVILLAAGFGTRLYPLTKDKPKALLPLGDRTLLDHLMENIARTKPESVTLITNNCFYEQFVFWKSRKEYPFPVHIMNDGANTPEEKKGAVRDLYYAFCHPQFSCENSLVLSTDNYFDYPLKLFLFHGLHHLPEPVIGIHDIKNKEEATKYGIVELDEHHRVRRFMEKPKEPLSTLASVGIYLLPEDTHYLLYQYLDEERRNADRIGDFIGWMIKHTRTLGIPIEGIWEDIGDLKVYEKLRHLIEERTKKP